MRLLARKMLKPVSYETETPESLELEDGDSIDVFLEQLGGVRR